MFARAADAGDLPPERGRRPAARARLQRRLPDLRRPRARALRRRAGLHHDEPADAARRRSTRSGSRTRSSARTSTRSGSACAAASRPTSGRCASAQFRAIAMSVFASGRDPAARGDRVGLRSAEPAVDRLRRLEPRATSAATRELVDRALAACDHPPRRLDRWPPEAASPAVPAPGRRRRPLRWATFDTPQSRSLLEGEDVEFVPFVGGRDLVNVARNLPHARRILTQHRRRHDGQHRLGGGAAVLRARPRARGCAATTSRAPPAARGRRLTGAADRPDPRRPPLLRSTPAWAGGALALPRLGLRLLHRRRARPRGSRDEIRKVVVTLGTYKDYGFPRLIERLLEILPPEAEVLWQTGDTDVAGLADRGPPRDP